MGKDAGIASATIRWPSGLTQSFDRLPANHRIEIQEGSQEFQARPFAKSPASYARTSDAPVFSPLPSAVETWLLQPLSAPEFSLPDLVGNRHELQTYHGGFLLLNFWATNSQACVDQLRLLRDHQSVLPANLRIVGLNVDDPRDIRAVQSFIEKERIPFLILLATQETVGIYNLIYRYLFDRRRNLGLPTSFLIDEAGMIVKVYQERVHPRQVVEDVKSAPRTSDDRVRRALPFGGTLHLGQFQRNDFTYGVAMFQRGYLDQAAASFKQVIANKPSDPEAHYNLGTLYLRTNALQDARQNLQRAVDLRPEYPEAWNNLGMIAAQGSKNATEPCAGNYASRSRS